MLNIRISLCLCLVSSRLSLSSGSFEFSALCSDDGFSRGSRYTGGSAEMFESLSVSGTSQENDVLSSGSVNGKLIEGSSKTTSSDNSGSGLLGEFESADSEFGYIQKSYVVSDSTNEGEHGFMSL